MANLEHESGYASHGSSFWDLDEGEKAPELRWPLNVEIYDSMRRTDAQVISVLRAVTLPIRRTEWRIDQNGASDEVTEFVARNLNLPLAGVDLGNLGRARDRFSWQEHLRLALLMLPFGHSFFEQTYRFESGRFHIRKLGWRPPRTISKIEVAADGGLVAIEQHGVAGKNTPRIDVDRLVAYVNDREGGNWLGASLLRPAYKYWILKDRMLRVQAQTVDRNGMGIPVFTAGETPVALTSEEAKKWQDERIRQGLRLAKAYRSGNNAAAALGHGEKLETKGVGGTLPDADKPIRYYDEQIARAVLAHFLNLGTETGSWALGSTFADFFTLSLQTVANQIADVATQHIVDDLVDLNFGPDVPAPRVAFDEIGSRHPASADAVRALIECGALTADDDLESFIRTTYGLPQADPDTARERPKEAHSGTQSTEG